MFFIMLACLNFLLSQHATLTVLLKSPTNQLQEILQKSEKVSTDNLSLLNKFYTDNFDGKTPITIELFNYKEKTDNKTKICAKINSTTPKLIEFRDICFSINNKNQLNININNIYKGNITLENVVRNNIVLKKKEGAFIVNNNLINNKLISKSNSEKIDKEFIPKISFFKEYKKTLAVIGIEHNISVGSQTNTKQFKMIKNVFDKFDKNSNTLLLVEGHAFTNGDNYKIKRMYDHDFSKNKKIPNWQSMVLWYAWKQAYDKGFNIRGIEPTDDNRATFLINNVGYTSTEYARYFITGEILTKGSSSKNAIKFFNKRHSNYHVTNNKRNRVYYEDNILTIDIFAKMTFIEGAYRNAFFMNTISEQLKEDKYDSIIVVFGLNHFEQTLECLQNMVLETQ